jgi:hypothetical protein
VFLDELAVEARCGGWYWAGTHGDIPLPAYCRVLHA